jgi:hypothetical protein
VKYSSEEQKRFFPPSGTKATKRAKQTKDFFFANLSAFVPPGGMKLFDFFDSFRAVGLTPSPPFVP